MLRWKNYQKEKAKWCICLNYKMNNFKWVKLILKNKKAKKVLILVMMIYQVHQAIWVHFLNQLLVILKEYLNLWMGYLRKSLMNQEKPMGETLIINTVLINCKGIIVILI